MGEFQIGLFWVLLGDPRGTIEEGGHYVFFCALGELIWGRACGVGWNELLY
jgi:hypothetical protein